ncbi:hypothetical protein HYW36_01800, partial [Candidatus Saccharibacteria bacterium]|nr:hypothetical protein [Candidatus Saccharibacteria bacterium]
MKRKRNQRGFHHIGLLIFVLVLVAVAIVGFRVYKQNNKQSQTSPKIISSNESDNTSKAVKAGRLLSRGKCQGTQKLTFTHLPMREQDFSILIPYGLVVDDHVTPIDHQYFSPADYKSARDAYPVYAMADATLSEIEQRTTERGVEYRLVFAHSCTSLYYYDLVTSLSDKLKAAYDSRKVDLRIKAGEQIGAIGGQTLDFAYWDTDTPLTGFVNLASYDAEPWKIYTADPYPRYTPELRDLLIVRNPRTTEPIAGKIDYDQPGKLIGSWFMEGTNGYAGRQGTEGPTYSTSHLSIVPEHFDPSYFVISMGDYNGQSDQFLTKSNSPNPADVTEASGLIKYELTQVTYRKSDGSIWDRISFTKPINADSSGFVVGIAIAQLTDGGNKRKFGAFPKKTASQVSGVTSAAKTYT